MLVESHSTNGAYNRFGYLNKEIYYDPNTVLESSGDVNEALDMEFDDKGGIITFSTVVNIADKPGTNFIQKLAAWLKMKQQTLANKVGYMSKLDKIAKRHSEIVGWTIGRFLHGKYKAKNDKIFDESSISIEIIGITSDQLLQVATEICKAFKQETVLVKDYQKNIIYLANGADELTESDNRDVVLAKSEQTDFATISAFVDSKLFKDKDGNNYDEKGHHDYNYRANKQLLTDLQRLGLDYQKVSGIWAGDVEKSYIVWNTAYTFTEFKAIMLRLAKNYRQWGVCIGRYIDGQYDIDMYETKSIDYEVDKPTNIGPFKKIERYDTIFYEPTMHFTNINPTKATEAYATVLSRHLQDKKLSDINAIVFESIVKATGAATGDCWTSGAVRNKLLKEYLTEEEYSELRKDYTAELERAVQKHYKN